MDLRVIKFLVKIVMISSSAQRLKLKKLKSACTVNVGSEKCLYALLKNDAYSETSGGMKVKRL